VNTWMCASVSTTTKPLTTPDITPSFIINRAIKLLFVTLSAIKLCVTWLNIVCALQPLNTEGYENENVRVADALNYLEFNTNEQVMASLFHPLNIEQMDLHQSQHIIVHHRGGQRQRNAITSNKQNKYQRRTNIANRGAVDVVDGTYLATTNVHNDSASKSWHCGLINARSVCNKCEAICDFILNYRLSLALITETWLKGESAYDGSVASSCCPPTYKYISWPRTHKRGGGLLILFDDTLKIKEINDTECKSSNEVELAIFQVKNGMKLLTFALMYRPPNSRLPQFYTFLIKLCQSLLKYDEIILIGDLNLPTKHLSSDSQFSSIMTSFGLRQLVMDATHESGHTLDMVIVRDGSQCVTGPVQIVEGVADHKGILFDIVVNGASPSNTTTVRRRRNFHQFDKDSFMLELCDSVVSPLIMKYSEVSNIWKVRTDVSSDELVSEFDQLIESVLNRAAPVVEKRVRRLRTVGWWNRQCQEEKIKLRRLERIWRLSPSTVRRQIYLDARRKYHGILTSVREKYVNREIDKCQEDPKKFWLLANTLLGRSNKVTLPDLDPSSLSGVFNSFFKDKINQIRDSIPPHDENGCSHRFPVSFELSTFGQMTGADLVMVLRSMKLKQNPLDILPYWLFKLCAQVLMPVLVCIVNCVLKKGLPSAWKHSIITPLLKNSSLDSNVVLNYRPVSNFPTLVKVIEKIIANKIQFHLERSHLMDTYQSAYRKGHSCETANLVILNEVFSAMDRKEVSIVVLLDMSAAFDTVDHALLLSKLSNLGIVGDALKWLEMYLQGRYHSTRVYGRDSSPLQLTMGVPQGSVLGPLLFSIYIRDLGEIIQRTNVRYSTYADDVTLLKSVKPTDFMAGIQKIEECLQIIEKWTIRNFLRLNMSKTEYILLGTGAQLAKINLSGIRINGQEVSFKTVVRSLGVLFDSTLKFRHHIDYVCRLSYGNLRMLHRLRKCLSNSQFSIFAHALVLSRIDYCPTVLYGADKAELKKLQRVIKATFRATYRLKKSERISEKMKNQGWLSVEDRIIMRYLMIIHNAQKFGEPQYLSHLISVNSNERSSRSQSRGDLVVRGSSSSMGSRAFLVAAPTLWRMVSEEIRRKSNRNAFRSAVKKWLLERNHD
jgi:hypothetical protein